MALVPFPDDMFDLRPGEAPLYGDFPDLKKCVQWFISQLPAGAWVSRRRLICQHFYDSLTGESTGASEKGRFFVERDLFGWYLFLGESFTDHPWNYEVQFGCRVIPMLAAVGRNLETLLSISGFQARARQILTTDRAQANGGIFEWLVAAAYARSGWAVTFNPVRPGIAKTYDLDIRRGEERYAVECKRIEAGEYGEAERARMRELWQIPAVLFGVVEQRSTYLNIHFNIELKEVPSDYISGRASQFLKSGLPSMLWYDDVADGIIGDLDLSTIQKSLRQGYLLHPGPVFNKLLTGSYLRYDNLLTFLRLKFAANPHFVDELDLAVVGRWSSNSEGAIEKKSRDIQSKLVEANAQLPADTPGIIHIAFEALSGDQVEKRRFDKVMKRVKNFAPNGSRLEFLYCHYFAPEASPDEIWPFDETFHWMGVRQGRRPLEQAMLVIPEGEAPFRAGVHWDGDTPVSSGRQ